MAEATQAAAGGGKTKMIIAALPYIGLSIVIVLVLWAGFGLLKKFHIIGTTEADKLHDKQDAADAEDAIKMDKEIALDVTGSPLEANKFPSKEEFANQYYFSTSKVIDLCKQIYDAKGSFHDNEDEAIAVSALCPSKYTEKVIAYYFNLTYKKDLRTYLKTFMNDSQLAAYERNVSSKPDFRPFLPATVAYMKKNKIKTYTLK